MTTLQLRVIRGPDWKWGDQDGGEGRIGSVVGLVDELRVAVVWDGTCKPYVYRTGVARAYDLRILDNSSAGVFHPNLQCDECHQDNIVGMRWKCYECFNYDLCTCCYMNGAHTTRHSFVRVDVPEHNGVHLAPRSYSRRLEVTGLTPTDWRPKRCNTAAKQNCYLDHLPVVGLFASTGWWHNHKLFVGDRVYVDIDKEVYRALQEGHGGWNEAMYRSDIGTVVHIDTRITDVEVLYDDCTATWTINREALTKVKPLSEQDDVKIISNVTKFKKFQNLHTKWEGNAKKLTSKTGRILTVYNSGNVLVELSNGDIHEISPLCCERTGTAQPFDVGTVTPNSAQVKELSTLLKQLGKKNISQLSGGNEGGGDGGGGSTSDSNDRFVCPICMDNERDSTFTCGHGACLQCARKMKDCHMCRKKIEQIIELYH